MRKHPYFQIAKIIILLFMAFFSSGPGTITAAGNYALSKGRMYRVYCKALVKNSGGTATNLKIRFPVFARANLPPYQTLNSWRASPANLRFNNDALEYTLPRLARNQTVSLEAEFTFTNWAIRYPLAPYYDSYQIEARYLAPEQGIETAAPPIVALAKKIVNPGDPGLEKAKKIFAFVNHYLNYDLNGPSDHSALQALSQRHGTCEDYSLLFVALCRAAQVPARVVSGYRFDPGEVDGREADLDPFAHAWAEVYLPPGGWTTVDPTFVYTVNGAKAVSYDFFGNIAAQDRHLFSSYNLASRATSIWDYDFKSPAKVEIIFQRRIRGL